MKVLQLCHKPPYPPVDGGCLAMDDITSGLVRSGVDVKVLTLATTKHPFQREKIPDNYLRTTKVEAIDISTELNPLAAFFNLFSRKSYNLSRFYSADFNNRLANLLQSTVYDVVHLESLFVVPYLATIRANSSAKVVYRAHNVEQQIWSEKHLQERNPVKKAYLRLLYRRLKRFEDQHFELFDGIAAISKKDEKHINQLGNAKATTTIPFSINPSRYFPLSSYDNPNLFFIGSLDWQPNLDGLKWFLTHCWPKIKKQFTSLKFHIAGKGMPMEIKALNDEQIVVHGEIENAMDFIRNQGIMIVPLFAGSGVRIKVLEGLALGKALVATPKAIEGIDLSNNEVSIADSTEEFIAAVSKLHLQKDQRELIGKCARSFVKKHFDNEMITQKLIDFYHQL